MEIDVKAIIRNIRGAVHLAETIDDHARLARMLRKVHHRLMILDSINVRRTV